ncbi:MAG: hypothetical protein J6X70_01200 [Muribaculaceae bacterium]|nr:hypothetical protein [Muribaculaceae bacterium]
MSKEREEIQTAPVGDVDWGAISEEFFRKIEGRKERLGIKLLPISDIEGGKSIAKVVPNNLGKLLFFSTSNPNDAKHTPKYYAWRRILIIVTTLAFMALAWYYYGGDGLTVAGLIGFIIICFAIGLNGFRATDYFLGEKGLAIYMLNKNRHTVIEKNEVLFDDIDYILHCDKEIYDASTHDYKETRYYFSLVTKKDNDYETVIKLKDVYDKDNYDSYISFYSYIVNNNESNIDEPQVNIGEGYKYYKYDFIKRVEDVVMTKLAERNIQDYLYKGEATFPIYNQNTFLFEITVFANGDIKYDKESIKNDNITKMFIKDGILTIVYNNDNGKVKDVLITIGYVGNHKAFLYLIKLNHEIEM